ncbi:MAG TPA: hypothetical protein PKG90_01710 [Chitinophagaceae bacterium]|nr:hypothetical protein [Chitinophagaceae bacterium]HNU13217.1 hypothetical protein [Chitinophagaceae bacterium]
MDEQVTTQPEQPLAQPPVKKKSWFRKFATRILIFLFIALAIFIYVKFFYVFGEGSKAGELNFFVKKGYIFKTYEGRVIQTGYKSKVPGSIQSNEFEFSVVDEKVAQQLMSNSGAFMELHYKEYLGALPWRGMSKYVVDSIISIQRPGNTQTPFQ